MSRTGVEGAKRSEDEASLATFPSRANPLRPLGSLRQNNALRLRLHFQATPNANTMPLSLSELCSLFLLSFTTSQYIQKSY